MTMRTYTCPVDKRKYTSLDAMLDHFETEHPDEMDIILKKGVTVKQYCFNIRNRREPFNKMGRSIVSGKPTPWNEEAGRYARILPNEKDKYRAMFAKRMRKAHGRTTFADDPEFQKKMLAGRRISGTYDYDGKKIGYVGNYEKDFLEYMHDELRWPVGDLVMPANVNFPYKDPETGKLRTYIPDAIIPSLGMVVEIKASDNRHYRKRDIRVEFAKDDAVQKAGCRYIKVMDRKYDEFRNAIEDTSEAGCAN